MIGRRQANDACACTKNASAIDAERYLGIPATLRMAIAALRRQESANDRAIPPFMGFSFDLGKHNRSVIPVIKVVVITTREVLCQMLERFLYRRGVSRFP